MNDRLVKLLDAEQLSSSKFADVIGVQRSSVSHILSGRNKPSFDFLLKTLKAFPMVNAEWLMLGNGTMYKGEDPVSAGNLFDQQLDAPMIEKPAKQDQQSSIAKEFDKSAVTSTRESHEIDESITDVETSHAEEGKSANDKHLRKEIDKIVIFYSDNTFISYSNPD